MLGGWKDASIYISIGALLISTLSFVVSWRGHRRAVRAARPTVAPTITAAKNRPGWYEVKLVVTNRDTVGWQGSDVLLIWPPSARALRASDARMNVRTPDADLLKNPMPVAAAARKIQTPFGLASAGTIAPRIGLINLADGERAEHLIYICTKPGRFCAILRMRSREGLSRTIWLPIRLNAPYAN